MIKVGMGLFRTLFLLEASPLLWQPYLTTTGASLDIPSKPVYSSGITTSRSYLETVIFYFKSLQIHHKSKATVL